MALLWSERTALLLSVGAVVLAAGCYSSSIRVAQAVPVDKPRQRLYVVVHEGAMHSTTAKALFEELSVALGRRLVSRGTVLTDMEFDTRPIEADIAAFRPESLLVIKPIGVRSGGYGSIHLSFGVTLLDHPSNQTIWAAKAELSGDVAPMVVVAHRIVDALVTSRMIPGGAPARGPPPR